METAWRIFSALGSSRVDCHWRVPIPSSPAASTVSQMPTYLIGTACQLRWLGASAHSGDRGSVFVPQQNASANCSIPVSEVASLYWRRLVYSWTAYGTRFSE